MKEQFSRHWTARQWSLRDGKQMMWVLLSPQLAALRMFPGHGARRGKRGRACGLPEFRRQSWAQGDWGSWSSEDQEKRLSTGRTPEVYKDPTWVLYQHMRVRMLAKSGEKNYQEGLEITESGVHIGPGTASVPTNKTGKPHDSQRGLPQWWGRVSLRLNAA